MAQFTEQEMKMYLDMLGGQDTSYPSNLFEGTPIQKMTGDPKMQAGALTLNPASIFGALVATGALSQLSSPDVNMSDLISPNISAQMAPGAIIASLLKKDSKTKSEKKKVEDIPKTATPSPNGDDDDDDMSDEEKLMKLFEETQKGGGFKKWLKKGLKGAGWAGLAGLPLNLASRGQGPFSERGLSGQTTGNLLKDLVYTPYRPYREWSGPVATEIGYGLDNAFSWMFGDDAPERSDYFPTYDPEKGIAPLFDSEGNPTYTPFGSVYQSPGGGKSYIGKPKKKTLTKELKSKHLKNVKNIILKSKHYLVKKDVLNSYYNQVDDDVKKYLKGHKIYGHYFK